MIRTAKYNMKFKKNGSFQKRQHFSSRNSMPGIGEGKAHILRRHHTSFPFVTIPDDAEQKSFPVSPNNLSCFHGFSSAFTLQHRAVFTVDGVSYKSVDQYYQIRKVKDLLGIESEKFTDGSANNYSALARDLLKQNSVDRRTIDKWRVTSGVNVIQKALLEKVRQLETLRDAIIETGDKLIVHTYAADDFFGTGVPFKYVKDWCTGMKEKKVVVKIPMSYPLTEETLQNIPTIGKGRNVLGVIYMILREKINTDQLSSLNVDLIKFETASDSGSNSFLTKTASTFDANNMDIDFTADYDPVVPEAPEPVTGIDTTPVVQMVQNNLNGTTSSKSSTQIAPTITSTSTTTITAAASLA